MRFLFAEILVYQAPVPSLSMLLSENQGQNKRRPILELSDWRYRWTVDLARRFRSRLSEWKLVRLSYISALSSSHYISWILGFSVRYPF
jgi:hypothetical protein